MTLRWFNNQDIQIMSQQLEHITSFFSGFATITWEKLAERCISYSAVILCGLIFLLYSYYVSILFDKYFGGKRMSRLDKKIPLALMPYSEFVIFIVKVRLIFHSKFKKHSLCSQHCTSLSCPCLDRLECVRSSLSSY